MLQHHNVFICSVYKCVGYECFIFHVFDIVWPKCFITWHKGIRMKPIYQNHDLACQKNVSKTTNTVLSEFSFPAENFILMTYRYICNLSFGLLCGPFSSTRSLYKVFFLLGTVPGKHYDCCPKWKLCIFTFWNVDSFAFHFEWTPLSFHMDITD